MEAQQISIAKSPVQSYSLTLDGKYQDVFNSDNCGSRRGHLDRLRRTDDIDATNNHVQPEVIVVERVVRHHRGQS